MTGEQIEELRPALQDLRRLVSRAQQSRVDYMTAIIRAGKALDEMSERLGARRMGAIYEWLHISRMTASRWRRLARTGLSGQEVIDCGGLAHVVTQARDLEDEASNADPDLGESFSNTVLPKNQHSYLDNAVSIESERINPEPESGQVVVANKEQEVAELRSTLEVRNDQIESLTGFRPASPIPPAVTERRQSRTVQLRLELDETRRERDDLRSRVSVLETEMEALRLRSVSPNSEAEVLRASLYDAEAEAREWRLKYEELQQKQSKRAPREKTVGEEFRQRMRDQYEESPVDVDLEIDSALNHKQVDRAKNVELYVQTWLRRSDQWARERAQNPVRQPAQRAGIETDPAKLAAEWREYVYDD